MNNSKRNELYEIISKHLSLSHSIIIIIIIIISTSYNYQYLTCSGPALEWISIAFCNFSSYGSIGRSDIVEMTMIDVDDDDDGLPIDFNSYYRFIHISI